MLSKKYLNSIKNLPAIMKKIVEGTAPEKFTTEHLKKIGFPSSNDRAVVGLLKDLGFLNESGGPTQRYHDYRNASKSKQVLGEAIKEAYGEIFHLNESPSQNDKAAITGLFKSSHNVSDMVAGFMANTFLCLLEMADVSKGATIQHKKDEAKPSKSKQDAHSDDDAHDDNGKNKNTLPADHEKFNQIIPNFRYNIEIHLPATKDIEVYNSIFKSLKEHLLDD